MPAKLLGLALIAAGLLLRREIRRSHQRGYAGSRHRPPRRAKNRLKFYLALVSHAVGALVCFAAAYLCFTGTLSLHEL